MRFRCLAPPLWLGRRGRGGCREGKRGTGSLSGEGVILPGPGRDQRSQRSVGGEDAVVTVTVDAGRREDLGQPIQELQGREPQRGAAGGIGLRQDVEDLVGTAADQVEPVEGEGRPGTISNEPLEARSVGSLDTDAGIEAEPAAVIPAEHVLGRRGAPGGRGGESVATPAFGPCAGGAPGARGRGLWLRGSGGWFWIGRILIRVTLDFSKSPSTTHR